MLGQQLYALAFLEHGTRRLRITGVTCRTPLPNSVSGGECEVEAGQVAGSVSIEGAGCP
ncbi:hypothetical protein QBC98_007484, partial [Kitasatospora acidiphila]